MSFSLHFTNNFLTCTNNDIELVSKCFASYWVKTFHHQVHRFPYERCLFFFFNANSQTFHFKNNFCFSCMASKCDEEQENSVLRFCNTISFFHISSSLKFRIYISFTFWKDAVCKCWPETVVCNCTSFEIHCELVEFVANASHTSWNLVSC